MNQLFLTSPELQDNIKFEQNEYDQDKLPIKPQQNIGTPKKNQSPLDHIYSSVDDIITDSEANEKRRSLQSKYWGFLSKEMTRAPKQSNIPPLKIINHRLNIFKAKFDAPDIGIDKLLNMGSELKNDKAKASTVNSNQIKTKKELNQNTRVKETTEKTLQNKDNLDLLEYRNPNDVESGVMYYSFKKKMHLKVKREREIKNKMKNLGEFQPNKQPKDLDVLIYDNLDSQSSSFVGEEIIKPFRVSSAKPSETGNTEKNKKDQTKVKFTKNKSNIFDRLTKDLLNTQIKEEDHSKKRIFISNIAEEIYKDLKEFGDTDAFKKIAYGKFRQFKKDFRDKIHKYKTFPPENIKFTKNKTKENNLYFPNFELASSIIDKESIFNGVNDFTKTNDDLKESNQNEMWHKMNKILTGNMINFWNKTKDNNQ